MERKLFLPVIAGPTASGKTACAVEMCRLTGGEVISADSMQVYRGMDILTAKPAADETKGVQHHLLGVVPPSEKFSASKFRDMALESITNVRARGLLPVVCGGTGLYIDALTRPVSFSAEGDEELRRELDNIVDSEDGRRKLHDMLASFDPESAAKYHENDVRRVRRAVEIYRLTGRTQAEQARLDREGEPPCGCALFALDWPRDELYHRIDARVDRMVRAGLVDEVRALMDNEAEHPTAIQAIGYKEIASALRGESSMEDAVALVKQASRRYAKRQLTWFRRDERTIWIPAMGRGAREIAGEILEKYAAAKSAFESGEKT